MRLSTTVAVSLALGVCFAGSAFAQGTGRSLDIQPGARQNGLGAAGVALAEDATGCTWWNPAALGYVQKSAVEISYAQLVPGLADDVSYNHATYVRPVEGLGAFGLGLVFLNYGTSEGTDASGNPTGSFSSYEISPALSYGVQLLPDLAVGASLKYIRIQLAPSDQSGVGSTFGVDLAAFYRIPVAKLNLGLNVQNMGPSVTFLNEDQRSPLSRNLKVGAAWEAYGDDEFRVVLVGDFNQSLVTNDFYTWNGGAELRYTDQIAGRIGYYHDPLGQINDLTYGIGVGWKGLSLDFASIPQAKDSDLPNVSKITLGYRF